MSLQTDPIQQADLELLRGCIRGERRAWSAFVERFSRYIYYVIRRTYERAGISDVAEEIADLHNEIFIALLEDDRRRLRQYRGDNGCTVRSWVRLIAARKTLDALRRRRTHIPLEDSATKAPTDPGEDPLQRILTREGEAARAQLDGFIARLSATDQALLKRIYEDQASADEIAQALGIKKSALYTRKARLIKRLSALVQENRDVAVRPRPDPRPVGQRGGGDVT